MATVLDARAARASLAEQARRFFGADQPPLVRAGRVLGAAVVVIGVVLRFYAPTALWLDESISVNISKLSLSGITRALTHDGSPPLYYYLLHFWMLAFGQSNEAARALSGVTSVVSLPFFWYAGRRLGGRRTAWAALLLAASNPFAIYYATNTRMYAQMILLCVLGFLAVVRAMEAPTPWRLVAVGAVTACLLYTHYWGLYVVAMTGVWLVYRIVRSHRVNGLPRHGRMWGWGPHTPEDSSGWLGGRAGAPGGLTSTADQVAQGTRAARAVFAALVAGCVLWLPCVPLFVWQTLHTGTPWTGRASPADVLQIFFAFGGMGPWAVLLSLVLFVLILLGIFGQPVRLLGRAGSLSPPSAGGPGPNLNAPPPANPCPPSAPSNAEIEGEPLDDENPPGSADGNRFKLVLDLRVRPSVRPLLLIIAGTLGIAIVGGMVANAAFSTRYTAVIFPLFILVAALGLTSFGDRRVVSGLLVVACVAGLLTGFGNNRAPRTQAVQVAAVLNAQAQPGDQIVYCPDQLAPAVDRLLKVPGVTQLTFPRAIGPQRVDWVDYRKTIDNTDVGTFAQQMLARLASGHTLWLVYRDGYPGLGGDCGYLYSWFNLLRPPGETVVTASSHYYEYENLVRFSS